MAFQFKIQLKGIIKPPVWRRLLISETATFDDFHEVIQVCFGWEDCHLYSFSEKGYGSDEYIKTPDEFFDDDDSVDAFEIMLNEIFLQEKQTCVYIYDFGDDWTHKITLEKITDEMIINPKCLAGKGKCPPEDCGGIWGYQNFLETINNPKHAEYQQMREWVGLEEDEKWDVNEFDLEEVNEIFE